MTDNISETIADLNSLARFMRGAQRAAEILNDVAAVERVAGEANLRLKNLQDAEAAAQARLESLEAGANDVRRDLAQLKVERAETLAEAKDKAKAIIVDAQDKAGRIVAQAESGATQVLADARAERDAIAEEIVAKRQTGALVDAENAAKRDELDALTAKIDAAKAAIAALTA
jgi:polyhydroxyalkanoate synthesis regulator phasin